MKQLDFIKMNAAGNDFIVFDFRNKNISLNTSQIQKLSTRVNIGCDQVVILRNNTESQCLMEIYNPDGSSSSTCGNATRCVAGLLFEENPQHEEITIKTKAGALNCKRSGSEISVNMGKPKFLAHEIPMSTEINTQGFNLLGYNFYAINIGNPHIVTFMDENIPQEVFEHLGNALENHQYFPEKTNVELAKVIGKNLIEARVHERGAGETLSCGSGACAIGTIAIKHKLVESKSVIVRFKGGDIKISLNKDGSIIMIGEYKKIFKATLDESFFN
ncbi:MAG: diaminopimelate epimerase [Rickettsiales bacterium]|nr:diaminopimelate epimerase [Rickettsiales bacterium]